MQKYSAEPFFYFFGFISSVLQLRNRSLCKMLFVTVVLECFRGVCSPAWAGAGLVQAALSDSPPAHSGWDEHQCTEYRVSTMLLHSF